MGVLTEINGFKYFIPMSSPKDKDYANGKLKRMKVHRLIAFAFIKNENNYPIINHIDGNKLNNNLENLEWCTYKHNTQEAIKNGLSKPPKNYSGVKSSYHTPII